MTHLLFNPVKKNNSLDSPQGVGSISLVLSTPALIIILIILLNLFVSPIPKLLAYSNQAGLSSGQIDRATSIPSLQTLVPASNLKQDNGTNTSQSRSAMSAESVIGSFLSPKVLLASAIDQIRSNSSGGSNSKNHTLGFFANYKTQFLAWQIIPPRDFILLFNIPSAGISNGQISAKLPCNVNYTSPLKLFIVETNSGLKIQTRLIDLQVIAGLSRPAYTCAYIATVPNTTNIMIHRVINNSIQSTNNSINSGLDPDQMINSVGLLNPTNYQQVLPPTSSISLGFNDTYSYSHPRK